MKKQKIHRAVCTAYRAVALREAEYFAAIRAAGFVGVKIQAERAAQLQPGDGVRAVAVTVTARRPA